MLNPIRPLSLAVQDAVIWIVDSADHHRVKECRDELHHLLSNDCLRGVAVLIYANKQDAPGALPTSQIADHLSLNSIGKAHDWYIQPCSAVHGDGLYEGLEWLNQTLKAKRAARRNSAG